MSAKSLLQKLELSFWDGFIPLMSKSPLVRYIVPRAYRMVLIKEFHDTVKCTIILIFLGFIIGFVLGILPHN